MRRTEFDRDAGRLSVLALIPAFNEETTIGQTVQAVISLPSVDRVLVIDDGSTDGTAGRAFQAGAEVLSQSVNLGKGEALNLGLREFREDILLLLDGDLGGSAAEAGKLVAPLLDELADMTIARFPKPGKKGGFGLVKGLAAWGIRSMTGLRAEAPLSGQRALTRAVVKSLGYFASGYGVEVGLTIDTARKGFRILEVETTMHHYGQTGRNLRGFLHRGKQFVHVARVIMGRAVRFTSV